ncbi:MAG: disulfide bond formation protein B [bacterium]|nr:disulfide bond formation protein B [bacterium]
MILADGVNLLLGVLGIIAQVIIVWLLLSWLFGVKVPAITRTHALHIAFAAATVAVLGSLTYSDILGYEPCKLCWIQRILMYPQLLILGMALWGKHKGSHALIDVSIILSLAGAVVAAYQSLMQLGIVSEGACAANAVSCAQIFVMEFGYITIPFMACITFLLIALLAHHKRRHA